MDRLDDGAIAVHGSQRGPRSGGIRMVLGAEFHGACDALTNREAAQSASFRRMFVLHMSGAIAADEVALSLVGIHATGT
eukprot:CAMPEP_0197396326 /NCGR_PEP_ID=MMETSP1165-20131217/9359_1 /TAXON_ID=284809 /ORGANISM="Chrysocystis fragilis, Strain CCMP3189" /LENGTH=78 /DNA_ID=CAMNT_0042922151 /DNA_START=238 /DNA_END=470 /DNA_ORIENTATION=+